MGRVIMNGPPAAERYCLFCMMTAKQRHWEQYQDEIQAGNDASGDKVTVIPWPAALTQEILSGDYRGVCGEFPQLGIIDGLCWGHIAGINPTPLEPSVLDVPPPGLARPPQHRRKGGG